MAPESLTSLDSPQEASPELFTTLPSRVRLCYQTFNAPSNPPVILVGGATSSMLAWHESLIAHFAPYHIIRFDHRDTGLSTEFPVPASYTLLDMASDVEGLIRHLDLGPVHLVGGSLGGPIAWTVAARSPELVRTLTLLYTSPGISPELPMAAANSEANLGFLPFAGGDQRQAFIDSGIRHMDFMATQPIPQEERDDMITRLKFSVNREAKSGNLYSKGPNHGAASSEGWPKELLKDVKCPTTVVQAGKDQFFGVKHGETLAAMIKDAEYVLWEDVGHEFPRRIWGRMAEVLKETWRKRDDM